MHFDGKRFATAWLVAFVSVSAWAGEAIMQDGESDVVRNGAVISVSDSAEVIQYRPASMYDGKAETAWLTGAAQDDHDIDIHWFKKNVSLSGVWLDFTPVTYKYQKHYSYLSIQICIIKVYFRLCAKSIIRDFL